MTHVAIIPARGGSKRVPGKNIRILGDKPLIAWTIQAANNSKCFDRVIVSTDDPEISAVAKEFGAEVPFLRPAELSTDTATSNSVIEHAVEWIETEGSGNIETITLLQPTSPFRTAEHIKESFQLFEEKKAEGIVSVVECNLRLELCNTLPVDRSLSGFLDGQTKRTQDMEKLYELNGAIYLFKRGLSGGINSLYKDKVKTFAFVMNSYSSIDIDNELDFKWAEFLLENYEY